jgi:hypothetical protein
VSGAQVETPAPSIATGAVRMYEASTLWVCGSNLVTVEFVTPSGDV